MKGYPLFVFMHGLGMDKNVWVCPERSKVLAGSYPVDVMLCRQPQSREVSSSEPVPFITTGQHNRGELRTLFHDLMALDMPCLCFTLQRPANTISYAISDLLCVLDCCRDYTRHGVVIVGHSRGGVIARRFAESVAEAPVLGVVTISSPHGGSMLAKWATVLSRFTSFVMPYLDEAERGSFLSKLRRSFSFLSSKAVDEMLPGSELLRCLATQPSKKFFALTIGTTRAELFSLYKVQATPCHDNGNRTLTYKRVLSFPETLAALLPDGLVPEEITDGLGDGIVSERSSRLPYADRHLVYPLNHVEVLFDETVRADILTELRLHGFI
ncbi:MAG: alpha/beta fold hydrolase [Nitrospirae bacterium]|uniref:esterase/lipase family protein n=1 Tax=Candidatus Magnetobacterium casense TaxID=1455061 RepID=UPI00138E2A9C|nr:alpha/beta hydrolase [Candidatus Magnetobacterium casensis]MBF0336489.1 alpha/beta fold hydrolase [Nitrospirota bacterium]